MFFQALKFCFFKFAFIPIAAASRQVTRSKSPSFDWASLKPSSDLTWHECYSSSFSDNSFQQAIQLQSASRSRTAFCARLSLPLDYHNASNPHNVSVPIFKITSPPSSSHRGTIIVALGGAGNSRIQDFVNIGPNSEFFDWIDPEFEHDFLTFDNRGFGYSSPSAKCFDCLMDSKLWDQKMTDLSGVISTEDDEGLEVMLAAARAKGKLCEEKEDRDLGIRKHMSTAYAARDMLEILKRLPISSKQQENQKISKLNFLGDSYGTMLGQTFASMYPEYVSRMVLDGTVDGKDWTGKWQMQHLIDVDAIWASFHEDCFQAKEACPLWRESDVNSTTIENRAEGFLETLKRRPLYTIKDGNARLITYRDVKLAIYWTTMAPASAAPTWATILDGLIKGHTNITLEFPFEDFPTTSDCPNKETQETLASSNSDAGRALNCGDAEDTTNSTIQDFKTYLSALETHSSLLAFFQAERKIRCLGWPIRPTWRFTGPFTSNTTDEGGSKLSTPILFISNKLDPMTSLKTARKVAKDYPGSVVLEQDARSHTVLANTVPSECILGCLREYLRSGKLPVQGTVCGRGCNLFDGSCVGGERLGSHSPISFGNIW